MPAALRRLSLTALPLGLALALAACGRDDAEKASPAAPTTAVAADGEASAPATPTLPSTEAKDTRTLLSAMRDYAAGDCSTARRKLDDCPACESAEQKPQRELLLAYCKERETPKEARALYEALITAYPKTEVSAFGVMRVRQLDAAELPPLAPTSAKPIPVERPQPAYPTLAQQAGVEGKVQLRFDVGDDGRTRNVRVVESSPPLVFDAVALYAVSAWQYEKGHPAPSQQVVLRFDLSDADVAAAKRAAGDAPAAGEPAR